MLEQRLPRDIADAISQTLSNINEVVELDLSRLNVFCVPTNVDTRVRLPIWDKITVKRTTDVFFVGRIIEARVNITLGARANL